MTYYNPSAHRKAASYHCYVCPYYQSNHKTHVLIARKKFYGPDGFIHNNPGQWVLVGGGARPPKNDYVVKQECLREYREETGFDLNLRNKSWHLKKFKKYAILFCHIRSPKERNALLRLRPAAKYKELNQIRWIELEDAIDVFSCRSNNPEFGDKAEQKLTEYIRYVARNWLLIPRELKEFKKYLETAHQRPYSFRDYDHLVNGIYRNLKWDKHYSDLVAYLKDYIYERSYIDWFHTGLTDLEQRFSAPKKPKKQ